MRMMAAGLVVMILAFGCRKSFETAPWALDVLAPVAHGNLNLSHQLPDEFQNSDASDLLILITKDTLFNVGIDSVFEFPDFGFDTVYGLPFTITPQPGIPFYTETIEIEYDLDEVRITEAVIERSSISVALQNTIDFPVLFIYTIGSATNSAGLPFKVEQRVEANSSFAGSYTIDDYTLNMRGENNGGHNTVVSEVQAMIHPSVTGTATIKAGEQFKIANSVSGVVPRYVRGYFGEQTITYSDSQSISTLSQLNFETLDLALFDVGIEFSNGLGMDLSATINNLASFNQSSNAQATLNHSIIGAPISLGRATLLNAGNGTVRSTNTQVQFTQNNSNLDALLEINPTLLVADIGLNLNPLGDVSLGNDFAYTGHNFRAVFSAAIPMQVAAQGLVLLDTFDFELGGDTDNVELLNHGVIRAHLSNGYPLDAEIQFSVIDSTGVELLDLLPSNSIIDGATENSDGWVTEPQVTILEIPIDRVIYRQALNGSRIAFHAVLNTTGDETIHLRSNSSIGFKLVADLNVNTRR